MKLFKFLLEASRSTVQWAVLFGAIGGAASIGLLALIRLALRPEENVGVDRFWLAIAFAALCAVVLATRQASHHLLSRLSQRSVSEILRRLCGQIVDAPLRRLEEVGQHRLLTTLTEDILMISQALNGIPVAIVNLIVLALGLGFLAWLSPALFLPLVGVLILGVSSYTITSRNARKYLKQGREQTDVLMGHVRTLITGVKELKLNDERRDSFFRDSLEPADQEVRELQLKGFAIQAAAVHWGRMLFLITIGLVLFVWPQIAAMDRPTQTACVLTILFLMAPLERIMAYLPLFSRAQIGLRKVRELGLSLDRNEPATGTAPTSWNRVELDAVSFSYVDKVSEREFKLGPLSIEITPGEIVFIVGGNGGGKTTLIKLLTGLYVADAGEIRLDGQPLSAADLPGYRQLFGVVFDEPVLFDRLLGLHKPGVEEQARRYLRELELDGRVTIQNGALSTVELSKGQRKRLALLTAYLEDRSIYVFDEWAADQDPVFKRVFYREILPELRQRGKTVVAVTHDDQYFDAADRIVRLSEGRLIEAAEIAATP